MSGLTNDIKKLLQIKYKARHDGFTDQYNRIFMVKLMMAAAFLTGMNWYKDDIKCIIPKTAGISPKFVAEACWINGMFVYKQLKTIPNFEGYYGIPYKLDHNGTNTKTKQTCTATFGHTQCKPMTKLFYLQYQWLPFVIAALSMLFYLPYVMFRYINSDLMSLKEGIKKQEPNIDDIVRNYFNNATNSKTRQNSKIPLNILVKLFYLLANITTFQILDDLLNGDFKSFGSEWISWSRLSNFNAYNYVDIRTFFKAGEVMLPTFGICEVKELSKDLKHELENEHKFVCELSQNILYHYVLITLWVFLIIGITISVCGFVACLVTYLTRSEMFTKTEVVPKRVYRSLTVRQREYLDFIGKKNLAIYGMLIRKLNEIYDSKTRPDQDAQLYQE